MAHHHSVVKTTYEWNKTIFIFFIYTTSEIGGTDNGEDGERGCEIVGTGADVERLGEERIVRRIVKFFILMQFSAFTRHNILYFLFSALCVMLSVWYFASHSNNFSAWNFKWTYTIFHSHTNRKKKHSYIFVTLIADVDTIMCRM